MSNKDIKNKTENDKLTSLKSDLEARFKKAIREELEKINKKLERATYNNRTINLSIENTRIDEIVDDLLLDFKENINSEGFQDSLKTFIEGSDELLNGFINNQIRSFSENIREKYTEYLIANFLFTQGFADENDATVAAAMIVHARLASQTLDKSLVYQEIFEKLKEQADIEIRLQIDFDKITPLIFYEFLKTPAYKKLQENLIKKSVKEINEFENQYETIINGTRPDADVAQKAELERLFTKQISKGRFHKSTSYENKIFYLLRDIDFFSIYLLKDAVRIKDNNVKKDVITRTINLRQKIPETTILKDLANKNKKYATNSLGGVFGGLMIILGTAFVAATAPVSLPVILGIMAVGVVCAAISGKLATSYKRKEGNIMGWDEELQNETIRHTNILNNDTEFKGAFNEVQKLVQQGVVKEKTVEKGPLKPAEPRVESDVSRDRKDNLDKGQKLNVKSASLDAILHQKEMTTKPKKKEVTPTAPDREPPEP